jgi:phospholipase C
MLTAVLLALSSGQAFGVSTPARQTAFASEIDHVVIIMMENHAYDNYFETYCLQVGPYCNDTANGIEPGTHEPMMNVSQGYIVPWTATMANITPHDMPHNYINTVDSINGGKENGYYSAEGKNMEPFGHYNGTTLPVYWDMAQEFAIGDNFFSSALSYSLPNHWYLIAGQAPPISIKENPNSANAKTRHTYLNESNSTRTVEDLLNNSGISFRYYDWPLTSYQNAIQAGGSATGPGTGSAYDFWNPMAAKAESYNQYFNSHFVARDQIFGDLTDRNLPAVSYVIPQYTFSDHPDDNLTKGEAFVANVVDAVEFSPYWNHTAIFLMWDDYGGYFDHVPPPRLDTLGLSSRVPFLVISPYTPAGAVVHTLGYFESTLSFIEHRWGLTSDCLTVRDCDASDLGTYFNFSMAPRAPVFFDPNYLYDTYPYHYEPYRASDLNTTGWVGNDSAAADEDDVD